MKYKNYFYYFYYFLFLKCDLNLLNNFFILLYNLGERRIIIIVSKYDDIKIKKFIINLIKYNIEIH